MAVGLNIGKAPKNRAVLPFYGTAAISFLIISVLLFISSNQLISTAHYQAHYFVPHLLSIVHIIALGWGTMVIFGAAYQLLPVICENDLYSSNLAFISYLFLTIGISILAYTFWFFHLGAFLLCGGLFIVISALLYVVNVLKTAQPTVHSSMERMFIISSAFWLLFTTILGLLLAINLVNPFIQISHLEILKLHAHAGIAGWFLQLIIGVSIKLVPMFLLGKSAKTKLIKVSFLLQNSGLLMFLIDGFFFGVTYRTLFYSLLVVIGIGLWLYYIQDVFKNRMKKKIDTSMKHTIISFSSLGLACLALPVIYFSNDMRWVFLYGTLLFFGWISAIILGMTFKTLPFIVWNNHYKKLNGKAKIPLPKDLFINILLTNQFYLFSIGLPLIALGIITQNTSILQIGCGLLTVVALLYLVNVIKILTHKTTVIHGPKR